MKFLSLLLIAVLPLFSLAQSEHYLIVGTYTNGKSEGIYVFKFDSKTGTAKEWSHVASSNPSYLAISPNKKFVLAVNENADTLANSYGGEISSFSFNSKLGTLTPINKVSSGGEHPCYVAMDAGGKWAIIGNYSSGTISINYLDGKGTLFPPNQILKHQGSGPNKARQEAAHVHSTVFSKDFRYVFTPDLGTDTINAYRFDKSLGKLFATGKNATASSPGGGPRHFEFHPNNKYAYLMEELTGTVQAFQYNSTNGSLKSIQSILAIDTKDAETNFSADIHVSPNGKFLYCTNRGVSNTITSFKIDPATGKLSFVDRIDTQGIYPRNFTIDPSGQFVLVANQKTDEIIVFKIDPMTGKLKETGTKIPVYNPVCLKWL